MKKIQLDNVTINFLNKVLGNIQLEDKQAHARRRFMRDIRPFVQDVEAEQRELQIKYSEKDASGNCKIDNNQYVFSAKNRKEFNRKWDELNAIKITIDVTPANEQDLATMQTVLRTEADRCEKEDAKGKFNADVFDFVSSLREAADALTPQ